MAIFFDEKELLNCEDEELKKHLIVLPIDEEHNVFILDISWDSDSDFNELLEYHTTDHFKVFGKYQIWAEIKSLYISTLPKPHTAQTLSEENIENIIKGRCAFSIMFQFY
jgi:hypothetical protein